MVAIPDTGANTTLQLTGTKLLLLGMLLTLVGIGIDANAFVLIGLVTGIAGIFREE